MPATSRPRRFDLIAFDWDGTLFDSTAIIVRSIQEAVRDVGGAVPTDEAASYVIGMALTQALAHAAPDVPPEKRPSVISPTESPRPSPMIAEVGDSISRMPGPPLGPS